MRFFPHLLLPFVTAGSLVGEGPPQIVQTKNSQPGSLSFKVLSGEQRFRYRLENVDPQWIEPQCEMNLSVRFLKQDNHEVLRINLPVTGTSPGWKQDFLNSSLQPRSETLAIPDGTQKISFAITSAGPPAALGIYLVRGLNANTTGVNGIPLLIDGAAANPKYERWRQSGLNPGMARRSKKTLFVEDNDFNAHADWELNPFPVTGKELILTWQEAYSISLGVNTDVAYDRLPPGDYKFIVDELTTSGHPTGKVNQLSVTVPRTYWQTRWFWLLVITLIGLLITLINRSLIRRKVQRAIRHARIIENERLRIAMDLHDDIGTRLSQIFLVGSHAAMNAADDYSRESFNEINTLTRNLVSGLSETVWTLNPKNNDLESLVVFLCRITSELCRHGELRCRINADPEVDDVKITNDFRHHFLLSVKEALNNALRHSGGSEIRLVIHLLDSQFQVQITDNGTGYRPSKDTPGNGLESMKHRMQELKGSFKLIHPKEGGLTVSLSAPIK
ncbi:MAG: histidine kinase [Akkermansiaceae bacterium]|jgi:two-component sensor histidine kinase